MRDGSLGGAAGSRRRCRAWRRTTRWSALPARAGARPGTRPPPVGEFSSPHGRPTRPRPGPRRGFHVPHQEDAAGEGAVSNSGTRGIRPLARDPHRSLRAFPHAGPTVAACMPSRSLNLTEHRQGFTCVRPSSLPLTHGSSMAEAPLGLNAQLHTWLSLLHWCDLVSHSQDVGCTTLHGGRSRARQRSPRAGRGPGHSEGRLPARTGDRRNSRIAGAMAQARSSAV